MNQIELLGKSIDILKSFNNTIVTCRIYPPEAPQAAAAVDRGYKSIKNYLREHGRLTYSLQEGNPYLCGQPLHQEIVESFSNLVIYRQLRLLGLSELDISAEMDRLAFSQLLSVFNASVEKIKNEGGGLEYITSLGLAGYFPEKIEETGEKSGTKDKPDGLRTRNLVKVRPEIVACLFGKDKRPVIVAELENKMASPTMAIEILAAGTAHILQDIQKRKMIVASRYFPLMLSRAETLIAPGSRQEVALGLATVYVESLKEPALCVLAAQDYPAGWGGEVFEGLLVALTHEKISGMILLFREQLSKAKRIDGENSLQVQFLERALTKLTGSRKGKHFLSTEKARNLMDEGERERKKRRLEAGIKSFLQGNTSLLQSEELVEYLPAAFRRMQKHNDGDQASQLLNGMIAYLSDVGKEEQEPLLKSIIAIGENLLATGQWRHLDLVLSPLVEKIRRSGCQKELAEQIIIFLQQVMQKSWQAGDTSRGDKILTLLHQIRSGLTAHSASIKAIAAKVQDRGIQRASLPGLLSQCLAAPQDKKLSFRLIYQGPVAGRFLVESLINADNAADRLKIIDLLTDSPDYVPSLVHERLQEHMVWYGKRNLIKLLGETGMEEDAESILPYLQHEDFRVQRETFLTLYKIGGKNRKQLLLRALDESSEQIKVQIIDALAAFCDPEIADKLVELLESHEKFSLTLRNGLLLQLMETLGRCPCPQAYKGVQTFLETRGQRGSKKISEQVWGAAEKALKFLQKELQETRKKHVQASQLRKNALKQASKISKTPISQWVVTSLPEEQAARTFLARGDKEAAVEQLLILIERVARQRNFMQAQKLREWLIEIDSTAVSHILRAAEIIDREKVAAIDKGHLEIWSALYDILNTDEFSAVYHALKHKKYQNGEIIIKQGALQETLFFINSGQVKLYFDDKGNEVLVKTMGRGEIFGAEAFFEASVSTISVASISNADISILKLDALREWRENFPGLEAKLHTFCRKFQSIEDFIKLSTNDRREYQRYRISGTVITTLINSRGRSLGTDFKVDLCDISEGGLSFLVRIAQKINGRLLLGRKMQIVIPAVGGSAEGVALTGDVLAVKISQASGNDYSLHLKFDALINRKLLHEIVLTMREMPQVIK